MSWYEVKITPERKADYARGGRILIVWDERPKGKILEQLKAEGSVILWRGSFSHDKTRIEDRGTIAVVGDHIITIEDRLDLNDRFLHGPTERQPY
ncbi:hypothetical protein [Devosia sp. 2618]|uniref:hypothetical protein n=1 Tax=Devosia sp. 2618 TaxID=3156454 RepID=UPI0033959F09